VQSGSSLPVTVRRLAFVADFGTLNFNFKNKFDMENKISTNHENGNDANRLLAAAANWWDKLTVFTRELYIGRHYSDDTPTPDKINALYKMYSDWSSEDLEQVSSCR
jgi:hypothetical protein